MLTLSGIQLMDFLAKQDPVAEVCAPLSTNLASSLCCKRS